MNRTKYQGTWSGIDSGREGLWKEPIWTDVLSIVAEHEGERVYDRDSPIYRALELAHPKEAWRSDTPDGNFRPLFRDYPNSWTRLGALCLAGQRFKLTNIGKLILAGELVKTELLVNLFMTHAENSGPHSKRELPFVILAQAFLETPRPLSTNEVYWVVMKSYRPSIDSIAAALKIAKLHAWEPPQATPIRRLRNMLTLMRTAGAISSARRKTGTYWSPLDNQLLNDIASGK
jgi:hypothetical protein